MELGLLERISSLQKSFNSSIDGRLSLDSLQKASNNCILDVKLTPQNKQQLVDLDLYNDQDDEGEIMLLAMILLQLHGVKLPSDDDLLNKKKRQRTSPDQLAILEQIFTTDKMPNQQTRVHLADQLGMSSRRVQIWFQNKRAKVKRSVSKPDGDDCSSPNELRESSSSMSPLSSPSSPFVPNDDESPFQSPSLSPAVVPKMSTYKPSLQPLDATVIISQLSTPSKIPMSTIIDNTTKQLKAQQLQFSLTSPFTDNQPVLTASY